MKRRARAWLQGLKAAFDYYGGIPHQVLCDNAKALIIGRDAYAEGEHKLHDEMPQMSKDYAFKLIASVSLIELKQKEKSIVSTHYLNNSFIVALLAERRAQNLELDVEMANAKVGSWLQRIAHQRIHGTTAEKPAVRLVEEVKFLQTLPAKVPPSIPRSNTFSFNTVPCLNRLIYNIR